MFLTTLVADAAAQHGHEFSTARPATPSRLSPIPRVMRPQSALARARPALVTSGFGESAQPGEPARPEKVMFKEEAEVKVVENLRRSLEESSEEESQRPSTETTIASLQGVAPASKKEKRAKKEQQPKTTYTFAHAAARVNALNKLKSRPQAVLQLQEVVAGTRPKPAFEVFPSGRYAKKLGRDLSRLHKGKDKLGTDDVVLCRAHEYDAHEDDWESQEVVGIVCASCKDESHAAGNAQLCLEDGSMWEAVPQPRGRYDFISTDAHGISRVVRWVPRRVRRKSRAASVALTSHISNSSPVEEVVYRFSTIDPQTRRHPVISTMTPTDLEISDAYYMPRKSAQEPTFDDSTIITPEQEDEPQLEDAPSEREVIQTAPLLRSLILLSGIYVALRNNWSPVFTYKKDSGKASESVKVGSCGNSVRSPNTSPTPSADRVPFGTSRRNTFNFHRRSSTVATSATSMSTALSGGFSENQSTEHSIHSRSTTPESRRRPSEQLLTGVMRSATDRFVDKHRQMSSTTESGESTAAEGSEYSSRDGIRTPTPSGRLGAINRGAEEQASMRRATASSTSSGLFQHASSLRKHWRMSSNPRNEPEFVDHHGANDSLDVPTPTSALPGEAVVTTIHRRRFSLSRGRARQRPDKTHSMIDNRPPPAYHNQQWWMNWGAEEPVTRPESAVEDVTPTATAQLGDALNASHPGTASKAERRSFSIASWRRKELPERPKTIFVTSPVAPENVIQPLDLQPVAINEQEKRDDVGFGGLMRRVTHRLRREERRLL